MTALVTAADTVCSSFSSPPGVVETGPGFFTDCFSLGVFTRLLLLAGDVLRNRTKYPSVELSSAAILGLGQYTPTGGGGRSE